MDPFLEKRLKELEEAREKVRQAGGPEKVAKHHAEGKLTARERVETLLDPNSLMEMNMLAGHALNVPGDGIVCGNGEIDGRPVFVYSQDRTVLGGSIGLEHGYKMYRTIERALEMRVPLIGLHEGPGARIPNSRDLDWYERQEAHPFLVHQRKARGVGLLPEHPRLRRHPPDLGHHGDLQRHFCLFPCPDRLHLHGGQHEPHVHHGPSGGQNGDR